MRRRSSKVVVAVLATAAMVLSACSGSTDDGGDSTGATGGSFSLQLGEPEALAPTSNCYSSECSQVIGVVWTGLLKIDPETSEQQLQMAESIESEDGLTWTIKLKQGWTFHNGEPVDAASFVRAWNHTAYGPNATQTGFFFAPVEGYDDLQGKNPKSKEMSGLKVVDDYTIEVHLAKPFSQWPLVMSYTPAFAPMAQECMDDLKACNEQPIGNGPYQIVGSWEHNQGISVEQYADYAGDDRGNAESIDFQIYANPATAFRDFQAGNLDIVTPDPAQVPTAEAQYGDRIVQVDSGTFQYIGFPLYVPDFQDVRIRQAMSMAIDRESIIDRVLNGLYRPATDVIAPFVPGSRDDACEYCAYDPEQAQQLYEEAGGIPGDKITFWFNNDGGHEQWVQAVANGWRDVLGLDYEFKSQPFTPYLAAAEAGKFTGPYRLSWLPDYPSPQNYLDPLYGNGSTNYGQWSGPERERFLDLVAQGDAAPTVDEGIPFYQQAADVVLQELPVIPLWFGTSFVVYSQDVENVGYSPLDQILLTQVTVNG